ncbi:DNA (cytosine-5-)-methyltransferase [Capnocytophaga genosp. AHN8471]|jgi:DNA (cytosine-5-)-methyltransferase|uniref:Cytosine-specific methyltransferase n=1 Tax=Capnocytophaga genosp. AHN8471 TaxID=327574 RepID=A0ABS1YX37_9FLAO|nr:DNA (cytosine-5-)-methyltransferase [Capnocytophaga genosp. AHN8471]MBM0650966.1 DNA (cytosine-5-)-methyltransferase [Capnocytophaga genosp. AHN8471]MBM0661652.1 DNA (cytosine-5-)-methyltransferase [Capnocytophaga genosp. AHN8471]
MKIIDLFSGIGGFALGFQQAGYEFSEHYFSEIDKHAIANYKQNFPNAKYIGDITTLHGGDFTEIDIITFGSPCQDFSVAGQRAGIAGAKSSLIRHAISLVAQLRPSIFVWENVKGVLSSNSGSDFWKIIQSFTNLGDYTIEWQLLNTSWVLPQYRERLYLVGHLAGQSISGVFPIREDDFFSAERKKSQSQTQISGTIKANGNMNADDTYIIPKVAKCLTSGGKSGGLHSDMTVIQLNPSTESNGRQPYQQNRVYDERGISPALTKNNNDFIIKQRPRGKNKGADLSICPTISSYAFQENNLLNGLRRLTEIECERLQGFPDNWTQYGNYNGTIKPIARTNRYKLIGNAVTVNIVEFIARKLILNLKVK